MRYYPAALALSLSIAVTASSSLSAPAQPLDPRAAALEAQGRTALAGGDNAKATDAFEAALALQPGNAVIMLDLANAARQRAMPGEALHYYRVILASDPQDINGLSGEGAALADIGALDKARHTLAQVQTLCGHDCPAAQNLANAITKASAPRVASAVTITPPAVVTTN